MTKTFGAQRGVRIFLPKKGRENKHHNFSYNSLSIVSALIAI